MRQLDGDIQAHLEGNELGRLMVQFDGLGPLTQADPRGIRGSDRGSPAPNRT